MTLTLGRLVSIPLREVWAHEANDFTPWLADADNLALLAETLSLGDLQVQGTEVPVGSFYIDILARDIEGRVVVIENQFGPTDHTHLGQILTYLAGQDGHATIVWIAERIREEHRAAIDWLNASTIEGFDFFAVQIEALRIGASSPAPRFNVVAKPNPISREVGRITRSATPGPPDERQKAYIAYWSRFSAFLAEKDAPFRMQSPETRSNWCGFGHISRRRFVLCAHAPSSGTRRTIQLYAGHRNVFAEFDALFAQKVAIEAEFGAPLDWRKNPKSVTIEINRPELAARPEPEQFAWFLDQMERFVRVFRPRIDELSVVENIEPAPMADAVDN